MKQKIQPAVILAIILLVALFTLGITKPAKTAAQSLQKTILFDFRNEETFPAQQKIKDAEADAVLKYVFGENYKTVADASVDQRIYGAFTKPDVKETLYFIRGGLIEEQENLSRGKSELLSHIAVFDGTTPVLQAKVAAYGIRKITDLNEDGKNELLLSSGFYNMGTSENGLALAEIENGGAKTIKDFGVLYSNSCESDLKSSGVEAAVVSYASPTKKGDFPRFQLSYYKGGCGKKSIWKRLAKNPFSN
jgi:hypothetical protein